MLRSIRIGGGGWGSRIEVDFWMVRRGTYSATKMVRSSRMRRHGTRRRCVFERTIDLSPTHHLGPPLHSLLPHVPPSSQISQASILNIVSTTLQSLPYLSITSLTASSTLTIFTPTSSFSTNVLKSFPLSPS